MPKTTKPTAYVLSIATNLLGPYLKTMQFPDLESARAEMKDQLKARIEMNGRDDAGDAISMMKSGMEYSDMALSEYAAHIYQDFGETWHAWRITPVLPYGNREDGT